MDLKLPLLLVGVFVGTLLLAPRGPQGVNGRGPTRVTAEVISMEPEGRAGVVRIGDRVLPVTADLPLRGTVEMNIYPTAAGGHRGIVLRHLDRHLPSRGRVTDERARVGSEWFDAPGIADGWYEGRIEQRLFIAERRLHIDPHPFDQPR